MLEKRKLIDEFMIMARIDSVSGSEKEMAEHVRQRLEETGLASFYDNAASAAQTQTGNLMAMLPGVTPEKDENGFYSRPLLLCAHLDTVPAKGEIAPKLKDDTISSGGDTILGADDKAGVAIILQVLQALKEHKLPHPPLEVVFTVSEEVGLRGSKELDYSKLSAKEGLTLDGGKLGSFVVSAPYKCLIDVEVSGAAAHSASPGKGINAIQVAAFAISKMKLGQVDEETTSNIGSFQASGPINIVPDKAKLQFEVRSRNEDKMRGHIDHINRCLRESASSYVSRLAGRERRSFISAVTTHCYDGFSIDRSDPFLAYLEESAHFLDIDVEFVEGMGGSDANNFFANGIKTVNMGVGVANAHTSNETLSTYEFFKAARLLLKIVSGR